MIQCRATAPEQGGRGRRAHSDDSNEKQRRMSIWPQHRHEGSKTCGRETRTDAVVQDAIGVWACTQACAGTCHYIQK